jgi:hypothetical protein
MSPIALFYLLLAGSPMFHNEDFFGGRRGYDNVESLFNTASPYNWESSVFSPEWMHPESSIFNTESSTRFFNSLLRKAIRNPWTSTRRSIVRELTGVESPMWSNVYETESMLPIIRNIRNIRRIAEVNPIMIEKILTRPESRVAVEALLRHVEPETLLLVEKLIRKNIPTYIREKVARRVVKSLVRSTMEPRRSILSELYPTSEESSIFSNIFESPIFESSSAVYGAEPKMVKILIEKLLRRSEVPEVFLSKIVRKIVKASIRRHHSELPFEALLSTSVFGRRHHNVAKKVALKQIEKVAELKALLSHLRHESVVSTPSVWTIRRIVKLVRDIAAPEHVIVKSAMKKALRHGNVEVFCNYCENVCESPRMSYSHICHVCHETCSEEMTTPFSFSAVRMNKERLVRKLVKSIVSKKSSKKYSKIEKLCRVCENVCESPLSTLSAVYPTELTFSTPVCRVCEEVCERSIFSRHTSSKVLRRLVKSSIFSSPLSTSSIFGGRKSFSEKKILNKIVKAALFEQF